MKIENFFGVFPEHPVSGFSQRIEFQRQHNQEEQKYIAGIIRQRTASLVHPSISGSHQRNSCHICDNEPQGDVEHASFGKTTGFRQIRQKGLNSGLFWAFLNRFNVSSSMWTDSPDVRYQVNRPAAFFHPQDCFALGTILNLYFLTVRTLYTVLFQLFLANGAF